MTRRAATPVGDRLILLCTHLGRPPSDDAWIASRLDLVEDWDEVERVAHDNRVAPRLYRELERLGHLDRVPAGARTRLADHASAIAADNARRLAAAGPVLQELRARGIDVAVLKGAAFAEALYRDPGYKRMNDVDLLVRPDQIRAVMRTYRELGLLSIAERVGGDPERQLTVSNHLPPYVTPDLACMIGTQWAFRSPLVGRRSDLDAIWSRTRPLSLAGAVVRMLGPEDNVHHVALHLERFKTGARDLMDLHNLVFAHRSTFDWELLRREIEAAGTWDDAYYALAHAQAHRPCFEVEDLLHALAPRVRPAVRRRASFRTRSPEVLLRICSRQFSEIEKAVSAFDATAAPREKLPRYARAWGTILCPPTDDALKIAARVDRSPWSIASARLLAPPRLLDAIAGEIGWSLLAGLALKTAFDLARSLVRPGPDLDAYAARLGLTRDQLAALEAQVQ